MVELGTLPALLLIVLWPVAIWFCTWKYIQNRRAGRKIESWVWFGFWCICITFIEWWVLSLMELLSRIF
jgi:hypothetical protein